MTALTWTATPAAPRIEGLDALRAICALCVVVFHLDTTGFITNLAFFRHGWMLVDFFFVLSGFVITAAYADKISGGFSIARYMALRFARVWPLHVVLLLCFLALELSKLVITLGPASGLFAPPREAGAFVMNLALLQVFGIYDHLTWNIPSWSIAAEFWVYLIAALVFRFAGVARGIVLAVVALACLATMALWGRPYLNLAHDGSVVRCLFGFCIGSMTHAAVMRHPLSVRNMSRRWWTLAELACLGVVVVAISLSSGPATLVLPLLFGASVFILAHQAGGVSDVLNTRVLVWLGSISYSIYMTHAFVVGRVFDAAGLLGRIFDFQMVDRVVANGASSRVLTGSEPFLLSMLLLTIVLIVAVSSVTRRFIEQPCNRWARQRLSRQPRASRWPVRRTDQRSPTHGLENVT